MKFVLKVAFVE